MKRFMLLHYGFEEPTPEIMQAWNKWFDDISDCAIEKAVHFPSGREISKSGVKDLSIKPEPDTISGYTIIEAEDIDAAVKIASTNPYITAIRVYEMSSVD